MTKEGIEKLPTLLDVINNQLAKEHRREIKIDNSEHIEELTNFFQSNYFTPIPDNEGICELFPNKTDFHSYFRGENRYHEQCFPSLFRNGMQEADIFVERLKRCEMKLMMKEYPMTPMIENGIIAVEPSGEQHRLKIKIGYDGLAQHYGIKTEYFDFTSDILTAAFFAATTYDSEKDIYSPITDIEINQVGAFYVYNENPFSVHGKDRRLDVVGLQPLARPGCQSAYAFKMKKGENLNNIAKKILFRHDSKVNEMIFNITNKSNRLFPQEILNDKIRKGIVNGKNFSKKAFDEARNLYYPNVDEEVLDGYIKKKNIKIEPQQQQWFSDSEKNDIISYWKCHEQDFLRQIVPVWVK